MQNREGAGSVPVLVKFPSATFGSCVQWVAQKSCPKSWHCCICRPICKMFVMVLITYLSYHILIISGWHNTICHWYRFWLTDVAKSHLRVFVVTWVWRSSTMGMTSLLWAHCLPANWAFQSRKSGWSTRSFFWFGKWSTTNGKIRTVPVCKNNCKLL